MSRRMTGIALAFLAATISGFSVFLNAFAVKEFGDATLYTTAKNLVAAALLVAAGLTLAGRGSRDGLRIPASTRERAGLALIGIFGGGVAFWLFFQGLAQTPATSAAFIQKTLVIWVAVLAVAFLRERFGPLHVAAIALLVTGQLALSGGVGQVALGTGESMILVATLLWSGEVVLAKTLLPGVSALTLGAARLGIGILVLAGVAIASGAAGQLASITPGGWLWALVTGAVLACYVATWFAALARAQAVDVTAVLVFGAVITALVSSGYRGAALVPTGAGGAGLVLIAAGTALVVLAARRMRTVMA